MEGAISAILLVSGGAFVGTTLRYLIAAWAMRRFGTAFPYGTLIVNLLGCALIGLVFSAVTGRLSYADDTRLLLATGLLGAETTFATFAYETVSLVQRRQYRRAVVNVGASVTLGLAATAIGLLIGERILGGGS